MISWIAILAALYLGAALAAALAALRLPRNPVHDPPDWGRVRDVRVPLPGTGFLETWLAGPSSPPGRGLAVLAHGWGRNRDKMTPRARTLGDLGFACLMPSMRDHGGSSAYKWSSAASFARDVEAVLALCPEPVVLYGHSAGAGGAIIAAAGNPQKVALLILEGCYTRTRRALLRLYAGHVPVAGPLLAPGMVFWMGILFRLRLDAFSPVRVAPRIQCPVLLIHGQKDEKFPFSWVWEMERAFSPGLAEVCIVPHATHTEAGETPYAHRAVRAFVERRLGGDSP